MPEAVGEDAIEDIVAIELELGNARFMGAAALSAALFLAALMAFADERCAPVVFAYVNCALQAARRHDARAQDHLQVTR